MSRRTAARHLVGRAGAVAASAGILVLGSVGTGPLPALAHTDTNVVAVPAGGEATVVLEPTHGCDGSPTVEVAIRAPVAGAVAEDVEGWTATSTPDGDGRTVLEWKGGSLPSDQEGEFPVTFTAPDTVGELLTFPSVQVCENGQELKWISGDPADDYPAPRLLILPPGSEPAATLDEVPPDAPGRAQLTAVVDVDNPDAEPPPSTSPSSTEAPGASADTTTTTAEAEDAAGSPDGAGNGSNQDGSSDDGSPLPVILVGAAVVAAAVGAGVYLVRRRQSTT